MKAIIIEDELPARAKLVAMLSLIDPTIQVIAMLGSVKESVAWVSANPEPDLAFVDIQLSDDHSFEIFKQHPVKFPVVFTTAYDKFLLESFEYNSIDYLLKPITEEKLKRSIEKIRNFQQHFIPDIVKILSTIQSPSTKRILAKKGTEFIALEIDSIAYFFTEHKVVFVRDFNGRQLIIDKTIAELESTVDYAKFFRLNRKYLCNIDAIEKFKPESGKILVHLLPPCKEAVYVSKETAPLFKKWIS
jgi:DNA-binding LytR/AlgR family response regulator